MQNTPENTPEKAPENPPEIPVLPKHPNVPSGAGWVSYNTYCPSCKTQTLWRATADGAWCNACGLFVEKTPSEDALVSIHAGDTIPTLCLDSGEHRETQTAQPYFVGGCDWGGSEVTHIANIMNLIAASDEELQETRRRILAAADIEQILQTSMSARDHTEEDLEALRDWIIETHLRSVTLSLVQKGQLAILWCGNEPGFRKIIQAPGAAAEQTEQPNQKEETHE